MTHQAIVADADGVDRRAYVKHFPSSSPKGLLNEWIGHTVMSALGVPQPDASVMLAPIGGTGQLAWSFVSFAPSPVHEGTPKEIYDLSLAVHADVLADRLTACPSFAAMVAADQLCMNPDRNLGNLVFTGKRTFVVIDHGEILGGSHWSVDSLVKPTNWVKSVPLLFCHSRGKLKASLRSQIYAASQVSSERLWKKYPDLRNVFSQQNRETQIALDAVWWRSLDVAQWFRNELQLVV